MNGLAKLFCSCLINEPDKDTADNKAVNNRDNSVSSSNCTEYNQTDSNYRNILLKQSPTKQQAEDRASYNMSEIIPSTEIIRSTSKIFDEDYIYNYLNQQINSAETYYDLQSVIHNLLPIKELKKILSNQLIKLRNPANNVKSLQTETNKKKDRSLLTQLYLQAASLEEIFSDDVLVNIVKFLPSNNYPKLPCISRNFRGIMKKYASIYRQYTIEITLDKLLLHNEGVLWIIINHNQRNICIMHRMKNASGKADFIRNDSLSIRRQFEEDAIFRDPNVIKYEIRTIDDISNKVPFLWYCCKKWNIESIKKIKRRSYFSGTSSAQSAHASSMVSYKSLKNIDLKTSGFTMLSMQSGDSYDIDGNNTPGPATPGPATPDTQKYEIKINETPTTTLLSVNDEAAVISLQPQDDENNLFVAILNKSSKYISSLCIDNINDKDGGKWYMLNKLSVYKELNYICITTAIHNSILEMWLNAKLQLQGIKYLDLNNLGIVGDKLKQIIELCVNLMVFDCYINNIGRAANDMNMAVNGEYISVKFPCDIEFIRLQFVGDTFKIDLSQCNKLCALYINDTLCELQLVLNTIESGNIDDRLNNKSSKSDDDKCKNTVTISNIIWPINGNGIECLLLDQAMEDVHNINIAVPLFINEWYNSLKFSNNIIPVRLIRYITHPFIDKNNRQYLGQYSLRKSKTKSENKDEIDDDDYIPEPPQLMNASPIRVSANQPTFTSNKYDDYGDPLKFEKDEINMIDLDELKKIVFDNKKNNIRHQYKYKEEIIRILDGDDDHLYKGYLWQLLLRLKDIQDIEKDLVIYKNWFDIGIGIWIREIGVDFEKHNFANTSLKFLNPYPYSNVSYHRGSRPNGW